MGYLPDIKKYKSKSDKRLANQVKDHINKIDETTKIANDHKKWFAKFITSNNLLSGEYNITGFRYLNDNTLWVALAGHNSDVPENLRNLVRGLFFKDIKYVLDYGHYHDINKALSMSISDHGTIELLVHYDDVIKICHDFNLKLFVREKFDDEKVKFYSSIEVPIFRKQYNDALKILKGIVMKIDESKISKIKEYSIRSDNGWLSPPGMYYTCDTGGHIVCAEQMVAYKYPYIKGDAECILEDHGWAKVTEGKMYHTKELSAAQLDRIERYEKQNNKKMKIKKV